MYLLKNKKNEKEVGKGSASPGDVIVSEDFRKAYLVADDGSHRRLEGEHRTFAINKVRSELAEIPARRAKAAQEALDRQAAMDTQAARRQAAVALATAHKSKGREWNRVYILGQQKYMPSKWARKDWQMAQELNLMYVATTRAKAEIVDVVVEA